MLWLGHTVRTASYELHDISSLFTKSENVDFSFLREMSFFFSSRLLELHLGLPWMRFSAQRHIGFFLLFQMGESVPGLYTHCLHSTKEGVVMLWQKTVPAVPQGSCAC